MFNWGNLRKVHELRVDTKNAVITGPNEAGKSTIIDAMIKLITPDSVYFVQYGFRQREAKVAKGRNL